MPELPEAEVVRAGLQRWVVGRTIDDVEVSGQRVLRRFPGAASDFVGRLRGRQITSAQRRGKFLWLTLDDDEEAIAAHLGMSGQLVLPTRQPTRPAHIRVRISFADEGLPLSFIDQRTFGWMSLEPVVTGVGGRLVAQSASAIAADPFEPDFDPVGVSRKLRRSKRQIKAALLDQQLLSGIGNIYADEALWRARRHWATPADRLSATAARDLLGHAQEVMAEALAAGGTSFDALYVNVNGQSGYFSRDLNVYGREGEPCPRCGAPIVREAFANRSSFRCPRCQRRPRLQGTATKREVHLPAARP
jgi:formamidopyrimidine-DNA glycosylase